MKWINVNDTQPEANKTILLKIKSGEEFIVTAASIAIDKEGNICYNREVNKDIVAWMPLPKLEDIQWRDPVKDVPESDSEVLCMVENQDGSHHAEVHKTVTRSDGTLSWSNGWAFGGMYAYPVLIGWAPMPEA